MEKSKGHWRFRLAGYAALFIVAVILLRPSFAQTAHGISLKWTASNSAGVTGYNVYSNTNGTALYAPLGTVPATATTYFDSTAVDGKTHYYVVTAVGNGGFESVNSNQTSAAALGPQPNPPTQAVAAAQ